MSENIKILQGSRQFLDKINGKASHFFLISAYTKTSEIEGISVAGLPGLIEYTPALDMEVLYYGFPKSMPDIAKIPDGPPSPVLITAAVKSLIPFPLTFVDTGLTIRPKTPFTLIDSQAGNSILNGSDIPAKELFEEGKRYAKEIATVSDVIILSECVPGGTTTAYAVTKALNYECDQCFSSSNSEAKTYQIKEKVVQKAITQFKAKINDPFDAIHYLGDPMQAFLSGMAVELSKTKPVILAGGTQMAAIYAILNNLSEEKPQFENIALMTTSWIINDKKSNIQGLLAKINPELNAFYSNFSFEQSQYKNLRLYDEGFVKEGVGAGSALCYAMLNGVSQESIIKRIEEIYKQFLE